MIVYLVPDGLGIFVTSDNASPKIGKPSAPHSIFCNRGDLVSIGPTGKEP